MKIRTFLWIFLICNIFLLSIASVSASHNCTSNLTSAEAEDLINVNNDIENDTLSLNSLNDDLQMGSGDIESYIINKRNYKMFFSDEGVLKKDYGQSILIFDGTFDDKGVLTIASHDTKITGRHALFSNTVFNLKADGVMLTNIHFVLDKEFKDNRNAGILINANNVSVFNCTIDYNVPSEKTGFAIYSNGDDWGNDGVNIINNTINYIGKSYGNGFNYGIILTETFNAVLSGNVINCSLPLRAVDWMSSIYGGSSMDFAGAVVADTCRYLKLSNNKIYADVNGVREGEPTLDAVLIYHCPDAVIENNIIRETDYITKRGNVNYLYGLDMYLSSNVIVYGNTIDIFTNGGKEAHGTAYPIQITGPAKNVSIAFNNIKSFSNGPNIGIYSQNFFGETQLSIISNNIDITGFTSEHSWALVAGIEVQDSNDTILNNTINVRSVNEFKSGYNLYGISYSQKTNGAHSFNIQYNKVKTTGDWAVALMGGSSSPVVNSIIENNILIARKNGGNRAALISGGFGSVKGNTDGSKHVKKTMSENDYPQFLKNYLKTSSKSNIVDFSWISKVDGESMPDSGKGHSGGGNAFHHAKSRFHIVNDGDGVNMIHTKSDVANGNSNSSRYVPGESGIGLAGASAGSSHEASSQTKCYEVTKSIKNPEEYSYIHVIISAVISLLLLVGYGKREDIEDF